MEFVPIIGLEVHVQLRTKTKIFCGCSTAFGSPPNTHTCPVCLGMPGVLPVLNRKVVDYTLRMAMATNCQIEKMSRFARKNYFYPDLPKGYQISQYELPIARCGFIDIEIDGDSQRIGITRIHMEEDAGKLTHNPGGHQSFVDYNRTGVPLMEIVSEPDIKSPDAASSYLRELRSIVRYLSISDGNMEEGSFRCDANISIMPKGSSTLGTRTEIKNLNSFKHVEKALHYEIFRQKETLLEGRQVVQETRLWNPSSQKTTSMRSKEEAHDYRYFPDPDLLPLVIDDKWIEKLRKILPELPDKKRKRFIQEYELPAYDVEVLTSSQALADYYEDVVHIFRNPKQVSNWLMGPLLAFLNSENLSMADFPVPPQNTADLLNLKEDGVISGKIAKSIFEEMVQTGRTPDEIIRQKGLTQVTDTSEIEEIVNEVLLKNEKEVQLYQNGKTKVIGFFMGQVMKATRGKADPKIVNRILMDKLKNKS